jgi:putative phage-type endonuclease
MPRLSAEQLAARKLGMGATDVVEALGLSPYDGAGPMRLFLQKTGSDVEDESRETEREDMGWGHVLEPVILSYYEETTGRKCLPGGHVAHPTQSWLWATLDAKVIGEDRIVEVKNVGPQMARHWDAYIDDGVPKYVRAQVTIGMACSGARLCDVVASVCGRPPHVWVVEYDAELAELLIEGGWNFWRLFVDAGVAPPLDATPATKEYLRRKYPKNDPEAALVADDAINVLGAKRIGCAIQAKQLEATKQVLDAKILDAMGTATFIKGAGWKMAWRLDKNGKRAQRFTVQGEE